MKAIGCITLFLGALLVLSTEAFAQDPAGAEVAFRVMTYNVGGGAHIPSGPEQIEQIADEIVDSGADIVGITEIDVAAGLHHNRDMVGELGVALAKRNYPMHHYYEPAFQHSGGWAVHAIFSRWAIRESGYTAAKGGKHNTSRWVMGHAGIDVAPGTRVHVFMTHFWPWVERCEREIEELFSYPGLFDGPRIIMGDFNMTDDSPYMQIVRDAGFTSSSIAVHGHPTPTVHGQAGIAGPLPLKHQIDYVVGDSQVRFTASYTHYTSISDHWPMVAECMVKRGNGPSEFAGDEKERPRNHRFTESQLERDSALELYRSGRYGQAAAAMLELERSAASDELKAFYAYSAGMMRQLDGDLRSAVSDYRRTVESYPENRWTVTAHQRLAFALKELKEYERAEHEFVEYIRGYLSAIHPAVTTVATKLAIGQIVECRKARGIEASQRAALKEFAAPGAATMLSRSCNYWLSLEASRRGDTKTAATHHSLSDVGDEADDPEYLEVVARGYLDLGEGDKAQAVFGRCLHFWSREVDRRVVKARWSKYADPDAYEAKVYPAKDTAAEGMTVDWRDLPGIEMYHERHFYRTSPGAGGKLGALLKLGWTSTHLHVLLKVTDAVHHCPYGPEEMWRGDSVQIALDPGLEGGSVYDGNDVEIGTALTPAGVVSHLFAGKLSGYSTSVTRPDANQTVYEIAIPLVELGIDGKPGARLGFNVLANDSDGDERVAWVDLTPGIGERKAPGLFTTLTFADE